MLEIDIKLALVSGWFSENHELIDYCGVCGVFITDPDLPYLIHIDKSRSAIIAITINTEDVS